MISTPPLRSLSLRPDDSLTIPGMALSIDFQDSVPFLLTIQATGPLTLAPAGLTPAEYTSLALDIQSCALLRNPWIVLTAPPRSGTTDWQSLPELLSLEARNSRTSPGFVRM